MSPSTLRLKTGQSATFKVTITNTSAPIDAVEVRLAHLEAIQNFSVRSPIAVKATAFSAPASISGSGESGTASFDVKFGYTGAYTAAAHGLVPATVSSGQRGPRTRTRRSIPTTASRTCTSSTWPGAAFFRVAIPPEATEAEADLDIYLFNPGGQLVASSTAGGTNEQIDITLPTNGTWSLFVHGWAAPGGDSDYDLYSWVISATPGGNLAIDLGAGVGHDRGDRDGST